MVLSPDSTLYCYFIVGTTQIDDLLNLQKEKKKLNIILRVVFKLSPIFGWFPRRLSGKESAFQAEEAGSNPVETASNHFLQTVTQVMGAGRYLLKWIEVVYFHKLHVIDWKY